jgi:penicillin G amidase
MRHRRSLLSVSVALGFSWFAVIPSASSSPAHAASTTAPALDHPPAEHLTARSALPPGESGYFPISDQATYMADKNPADFGPHVDDQRASYWNFNTKTDGFATPSGTPTRPKAGVRIYRDSAGVPLIYGSNGYNVWYGAGYAAATDRLFEMDAIRRVAEGTLGELTGASAVPADLEERIVTYTSREYSRMYHRLDKAGRQAISGYAAGAEARIKQVRNNPSLLPGEYSVLSTLPAAWTVEDTMAAGVFLTRDIASQGGNEMANVSTLRGLEHRYGAARGRSIFADLFPDNDAKAAVTISGRHFHNLPAGDRSTADRRRDFNRAAKFANTIPLRLADGPGTGDSPVPSSTLATSLRSVPPGIAAEIRDAVTSIETWGKNLHGGSFAYAIGGRRTKSGHAMVVSNPQLDYSYPSELYELEVHGGGYNARGVGVPSIPTVGIGHTGSVAWALTTGYSKTIDSFIETTRKNPKPGGRPQYRHDGKWHDESCRTVVVKYRATGPEGVPIGPANQSKSARACRTVHGPIVAVARNGRHARSVDYAQWMQDDQTVAGILKWDRAKTLKQLAAGVKEVRWNENIIAADSQGHIGYWHPGRYFRRAPGIDQRFPLRGTGSQDERGYLPFKDMPHVVDPKAGFVANWNTKPAHGWVDGDLSGTNTRPGGPANRVRVIQTILEAHHNFTLASLGRIDKRIGESDDRFLGYRPVIRDLRHARGLSAKDRAALRLLLKWDGRAYAPGAKGGSSPLGTPAAKVTDGPAATLFVAFTKRIKALLFGSLPQGVRARLDTLSTESHQYDVTPLDNEALRILRPHFSGLTPLARWAHGRSRLAIERRALVDAVKAMEKRYGSSPSTWRRHHGTSPVDSLSGVVGPSTRMPFEDRGTWVQEVAFTSGRPRS